MTQELWTAVDQYYNDLFVPSDAALEAAIEASKGAGLPTIAVSPAQGKLLHVLAKLQRARTILEIGTLGGYSTIWLARALPAGGRLISLEYEARHAEIARANIGRAGLAGVVEVRLGKALDSLPKLVGDNRAPFDLIFIDADKEGYPDYFQWSLKLSRPGTLIIADNVVRKGAIIKESSDDADVQGIRRFNELVAAESRVTAIAIQTVGTKGYDGMSLILINGQ